MVVLKRNNEKLTFWLAYFYLENKIVAVMIKLVGFLNFLKKRSLLIKSWDI